MPAFTAVLPPYWGDLTCYIVGGGPSLRGFPIGRLHNAGAFTLGVNDAGLLAQTRALFTADQEWLRHRAVEFEAWADNGTAAYAALPAQWPLANLAERGKYLVREMRPGLSDDPRYIHGLNSGFGALNLAYLKRARKVVLLGFDGTDSGHWHSPYSWATPGSGGQDVKAYLQAQQQCQLAGVEVLNASPGSAITAFPIITHDVALGLTAGA